MADYSNAASCIVLTADVVSAYVSNNTVSSSEIPGLISEVYSALTRVSNGAAAALAEPLKPAVPIKRSITSEYLVCLEDGKKFKSLKRHLRTRYQTTPDQYRAKWNLPPDYPMVAPNYATVRSSPTEGASLICLRQAQVLKQFTGPLNVPSVSLHVFHLVTLDVTQMKCFLKDGDQTLRVLIKHTSLPEAVLTASPTATPGRYLQGWRNVLLPECGTRRSAR
jgi:MucR family transcriptional regulator, transcriptional regulator of exopolysaccharide biosynthesis